jgi:hypothetical protein
VPRMGRASGSIGAATLRDRLSGASSAPSDSTCSLPQFAEKVPVGYYVPCGGNGTSVPGLKLRLISGALGKSRVAPSMNLLLNPASKTLCRSSRSCSAAATAG